VDTLTNDTPFEAGWTIGFRQDGRELIVVVVKGTFVLVDGDGRNGEPQLAGEQQSLLMADVFGPDPAFNAPLLENDYCPYKPECDVLLAGAAHSPDGRRVRTLRVDLRVGSVSKSFTVTGPRRWRGGLTGPSAGEPEPMTTQAISYDVAFGGTEIDPDRPDRVDTFLDNPVGRGFRKRNLDVAGEPMPVTEDASNPIRDPRRQYRPMALGPLGRSWRPRAKYAGTYDERWATDVAPMLPPDFDLLYFQAAPADQRMPYPRGGEPIHLANLVPVEVRAEADARSTVPRARVGVMFVPARGKATCVEAPLDTILLEPDQNRFTCSWRASHATVRDAFEIREVVAYVRTPQSDARARAGLAGKEYFHGLGELARARRQGRP